MNTKKLNFEHTEDKNYFERLFNEVGGVTENIDHFDFRNPLDKRQEFNKMRNAVYDKLNAMYGDACQLKCHPNCENIATQVDHLIPLSSNVLNKQLRDMKGDSGKKVQSQSFGSNDISNFVLACSRCNAFKKHRFPSKELVNSIKQLQKRKLADKKAAPNHPIQLTSRAGRL